MRKYTVNVILNSKPVSFVFLSVVLMANGQTASAAVHALFDLGSPTTAPFPSNWFTVSDGNNITRLRVNLPRPDCQVRRSDCEDLDIINTLDGFNLQPRISIPFDGPIDVTTVTSRTVFFISLGSRFDDDEKDRVGAPSDDRGGESGDRLIGINQIVWDVGTTTLHVQSAELLDQHSRYSLILTTAVRDTSGVPVEASETFRRFRREVRGHYKHELLAGC